MRPKCGCGWLNGERREKKMLGGWRGGFVWLYGIFFSLSIFFLLPSGASVMFKGVEWVERWKIKQERSVIFKGVKKGKKNSEESGENWKRRRIKHIVERPTPAPQTSHSFGRSTGKASFTIHIFCANHFYVFKHHECFMYCHVFFTSLLWSMDITLQYTSCTSYIHYIMRALFLLKHRVRREGNCFSFFYFSLSACRVLRHFSYY